MCRRMQIEPARLIYCADGTPFSDVYTDVYHAVAGGHAQAQHVFLAGNRLPARWRGRARFVILETGFGLGLNFLATCQSWLGDPARSDTLHFISLEKHPFTLPDLRAVHAAWPEFAALSAALCRQWPALECGEHRLALADGKIVLRLVFGDAASQLAALTPEPQARVDAFFLDGFSPAKNPQMWSPELCRELSRWAAPGATLATWSVAGVVRRALTEAGFVVTRETGFGHKRTMLTGVYKPASATG